MILESVRAGIDQQPDVEDDAPLLDWLFAVARQQLSGPMLETIRQIKALAEGQPSLDPWFLEVQRTVRHVALDVVSARAGDQYPALYVHVLVGALYGALAAVLDGPFTLRLPGEPASPDAVSIDTFLETTFAHLRVGF